MLKKKCGLIAAVDTGTLDEARNFLERLDKATEYVKIGPRLYALGGIGFVKEIIGMGYSLFLDLKLHDIPNTVAMACEPLAGLGLWALTLHTSGGREMMSRAALARDRAGSGMKLLGITVLTSLDDKQWNEVHPDCDMSAALAARAAAAELAGLDGIVCSPMDLNLLKNSAAKLLRVVPGIRTEKAGAEDQSRVASPRSAATAGADYIVVGRPILEAADPIKAAGDILAALAEVE